MEEFIDVLRKAGAVIPVLSPLVSAFVPQLMPILRVAELVTEAGEDAGPLAVMFIQVIGGTPLTFDQRHDLDATYDRLSANLMRPATPPTE